MTSTSPSRPKYSRYSCTLSDAFDVGKIALLDLRDDGRDLGRCSGAQSHEPFSRGAGAIFVTSTRIQHASMVSLVLPFSERLNPSHFVEWVGMRLILNIKAPDNRASVLEKHIIHSHYLRR